jgi:hypothetical protein
LYNDVIWQNRSFYIGIVGQGTGTLNQQNEVGLFDGFTTTPAPTQPTADATTANGQGVIITGGTGACVLASTSGSYWEMGVRGDTGPGNHNSGFSLTPVYSVLTDVADYPNGNNLGSNPTVVSQYCNGSRVPPEATCTDPNGQTIPCGYQVPPGIADATVPNPVFSLLPSATVDEGNNWINMSWGPLSLVNPKTNAVLGSYALAAGSPAMAAIDANDGPAYALAPPADFFGNPRKVNSVAVDAGATQSPAPAAPRLTSISPTSGVRGTAVPVTLTGTNLGTVETINVSGSGITVSNLSASNTQVTATFTIAPTSTGQRNVTVTADGGNSNAVPFTVRGATLTISAPVPALNTGGTSVKNGTITVTNTASGGTAGAFTFTANPTVTKTAGPGTFSITGGTCANGAVVNPGGGTCTINVRYNPGVSTTTSTAHVTVTGTGLATASQNGPNFNAN